MSDIVRSLTSLRFGFKGQYKLLHDKIAYTLHMVLSGNFIINLLIIWTHQKLLSPTYGIFQKCRAMTSMVKNATAWIFKAGILMAWLKTKR